jgi:AcrR family transcriptional regulator
MKPSPRRGLLQAQILTAAAELFRQRGYPATTLDDLARAVGVSKATLYGHFRSKEEILFAIFERTMALYEARLREIRRAGGPPAERLRSVIRHHVRAVIAERSFLTVFFGEEANLPLRLRHAITRRKARYDRGVEAVVREGIRQGMFAAAPARLTVFALLGMSNWVYKWYNPAGVWTADTIADAMVALAERGYLRSPARRREELGARFDRIERDLAALRPMLMSSFRHRRRG